MPILKSLLRHVGNTVEEAIDEFADDVRNEIVKRYQNQESLLKTTRPMTVSHGELPQKKFTSVHVRFADGTGGYIDVELNGYGKPDRTKLPDGAWIIPRPEPFPGSRFNSVNRVGHLLPQELQACQKIYDAVGRIGYCQMGEPTGLERIYGTGILISPRHILTNAHVAMGLSAEEHPHHLGIEFGAEKDSEYSDFFKLENITSIFIEGFDAAILTLKNPVSERQPVSMSDVSLESLKNSDILVIGYPTTPVRSRPNLVMGTKRYSQGKIFPHSMDQDTIITVPVLSEFGSGEEGLMEAVCHNASTSPGSSGSAVVNRLTGELVGLHFGYDSAYEWEEAANFAIPGALIAGKIEAILNSLN